jgi:di/tricarboxylate transporter
VNPGVVGQQIDPVSWKDQLRCGVVAVRSPGDPAFCQVTCHGYEIRTGDVLLLEVFRDMVGSDAWAEYFGVVRVVPKSAPPRNGRRADFLRASFTGFFLVGIFVLDAFTNGNPFLGDHFHLSVLCMLLLIMILLIKGLTVGEAYAELNGPILLIIAGALALGSAMQNTNLADCVAEGIISATDPMGDAALLAGLYFATCGIGMVIESAATVSLMGQIAISIVQSGQTTMPLGQLCMLITLAACACFTTPYGYHCNTYVAIAGKYTWGDFVKFGAPLQVLHMILIVALVPWLYQVSPGSDGVMPTTLANPQGLFV